MLHLVFNDFHTHKCLMLKGSIVVDVWQLICLGIHCQKMCELCLLRVVDAVFCGFELEPCSCNIRSD